MPGLQHNATASHQERPRTTVRATPASFPPGLRTLVLGQAAREETATPQRTLGRVPGHSTLDDS